MVPSPRVTPAPPRRWHPAWETMVEVEGNAFLGCWRVCSPLLRLPLLLSLLASEKTLLRLNKEGSASPHVCSALVSPLDPS